MEKVWKSAEIQVWKSEEKSVIIKEFVASGQYFVWGYQRDNPKLSWESEPQIGLKIYFRFANFGNSVDEKVLTSEREELSDSWTSSGRLADRRSIAAVPIREEEECFPGRRESTPE